MAMGAWSPGEIAGYNSSRSRSSGADQFSNLFMQDRATRAEDKTRGLSALEDALSTFGPDYGKGMEMEAKAAAGASNITAGLGGTSMPGSISAGLTAKFKDARLRGRAGIQQAIASFMSGFRDPSVVTPSHLLGAEQLVQSSSQRPVVSQRSSAPRQSFSRGNPYISDTGYGGGGQSAFSRGNPFIR